jgi:glutamate/tyrosine decarboxylase-like PLP-dependent enzyme
MEILEEEVIRPGGHPASGGHLAYLSGGGLYHSAIADYLAAVTNKFAGLAFTGPGPVRMENRIVGWVADLVGYPAGAGGAIFSGRSLANPTTIVVARDAHRLREDRARGLRPGLIVATAGTTETGAVDPLEALATIAGREGCWLHVDAAYGGFFLLTEAGRQAMRGIERSDSTVLDPHKGLFLPWGAGMVVVRDVAALRRRPPRLDTPEGRRVECGSETPWTSSSPRSPAEPSSSRR